jgi:hypothetical protein
MILVLKHGPSLLIASIAVGLALRLQNLRKIDRVANGDDISSLIQNAPKFDQMLVRALLFFDE